MALLLVVPAAAVFTAQDDLPEFGDNTFKNCIFGPDMECDGESWSEEDSSGVSAYCGEVGAGAQLIEPSVIYYQNPQDALYDFQNGKAVIEQTISYYDSLSSACVCDDNETCALMESETGNMEAGCLYYYSNNKTVHYYAGEYVLLSGNYYAHFTLYGYDELMSRAQAEQYYAAAKACLKEIVLKDACQGVNIPVPEQAEEYDIEQPRPAAPVPGSDPETISPLGLGPHAASPSNDSDSLSLPVRLCPFDEPVDISISFEGLYYLSSRNKVTSIDTAVIPEQGFDWDALLWKRNLTGEIDTSLPAGFGGLFPANTLPVGDWRFEFCAWPAGEAEILGLSVEDNNTLSFSGTKKASYCWDYQVTVECDERLPVPAEKQVFFVKPQAFSTTGSSDPAKVNPFSLSTSGLGGQIIWMDTNLCLDFTSDIYFGIYCPRTDPFNIYFVNKSAQTLEEVFQKVPLLQFMFARELPSIPSATGSAPYDWPLSIFAGVDLDTFQAVVPVYKRRTFYIFAISKTGVRDAFYAWILPFDYDIKEGLEAQASRAFSGQTTWADRHGKK